MILKRFNNQNSVHTLFKWPYIDKITNVKREKEKRAKEKESNELGG